MSDTNAPPLDLEQALHDHFGLDEFRPGQREVIEAVLAGRDVLCVMPTGGGKSLCYQLPAVLLDGLTLVVSPLIALMKDQVDSLQERGLRATLINSTLDPAEQKARMYEVEAGRYDLVYVAPERFRSSLFMEMLQRVRPKVFAVDEAHCISEWGHDFRPDYARLGKARLALGSPPCVALTATATDQVRRDIAVQLQLRDTAAFVTGFDRPNLSYQVITAPRDADKTIALEETLRDLPGSSIIYASSRRRCEGIAEFVARSVRRSVVIYHAGMTREERHESQERFMSGRAEVVVATNAFGMGVDKANIRSVIHYNIPGTLEAYYQEAGRAGRDGQPSRCVLLFAPGDRYLQEMFIENEYPGADEVYRVYEFLRTIDADPIELTHAEIADLCRSELREGGVGSALRLLEGAGAIEKFQPRENMAIVRFNADADVGGLVNRLGPRAQTQEVVLRALEGLTRGRSGEAIYFHPHELAAALGIDRTALGRAIRKLVDELPIDYVPPFRGNAIRVLDRDRRARDIKIDFKHLEARKRQEYEKLDIMFQYAQTKKCRRAYLLDYFGEKRAGRCGRCDRCGPLHAGPLPDVRAIDTDFGKEVLLKVLSGVARAKGRVGKSLIAQMLIGSGSARLEQLGLKSLSTFGILANQGLTRQAIVAMIEALISAGLIESRDTSESGPAKMVVSVSDQGWEWLRARGPTPLTLDLAPELADYLLRDRERPQSEEVPAEPPAPVDRAPDSLEARLKALRRQWAQEANLKAYHIFNDRVLEALVAVRPATVGELAAIKGVGPATLERYGDKLLRAIRDPAPEAIVAGPPVQAEATPQVVAAIDNTSRVTTEEWTWRLLERGFKADEISAIRGLDDRAILRHATKLARQGKDIPLGSFLDDETLQLWGELARDRPGEIPQNAEGRHALWGLFLECRGPK